MIADLAFYVAAVPAVLVAGVSKGGFGGGIGMLAVPLMTLFIGPVEAAAIMLPLLCCMDLVGVWAYRNKWDYSNIRILIPAAIVGIVIGSFTFRYLDAATVRLMLGGIAMVFSVNWWLGRGRRQEEAAFPALVKGGFWGAVAGFTSFVAHAGGPPVNVYLLPQRLDRTVYQATTVIFFISVNYVKLIPYSLLGQFSIANLSTSLVLAPLVPVGMGLGIWLHKRVSDVWFYRFCYFFLFFTGLKLMYDGVLGLME